jgi:hypothetical protein
MLQVANQCPFKSGSCYAIADRATYGYLKQTGAISGLRVVAQQNDAKARGGVNLLLNSFHAYVVSPQKAPSVNLAGAQAFVSFLASPEMQAMFAAYPTPADPVFFPDARLQIVLDRQLPGKPVAVRSAVILTGRVLSRLPGAQPLNRDKVALVRVVGGKSVRVSGTKSDASGRFRLVLRAGAGGVLRVAAGRYRDLLGDHVDAGTLRVAKG